MLKIVRLGSTNDSLKISSNPYRVDILNDKTFIATIIEGLQPSDINIE